MASAAIDELRKQGEGFTIERYTVPGIKDLAAGARILFDRRTREHAANAYDLLFRPAAIRARAGTGQREGFADAGPLQVTRT